MDRVPRTHCCQVSHVPGLSFSSFYSSIVISFRCPHLTFPPHFCPFHFQSKTHLSQFPSHRTLVPQPRTPSLVKTTTSPSTPSTLLSPNESQRCVFPFPFLVTSSSFILTPHAISKGVSTGGRDWNVLVSDLRVIESHPVNQVSSKACL